MWGFSQSKRSYEKNGNSAKVISRNQRNSSPPFWKEYLLAVIFGTPLAFVGLIILAGNGLHERPLTTESIAIINLLTISQAEASFHIDHGRYGSFAELVDAKELTPDWGTTTRQEYRGYRYELTVHSDSFEAYANPVKYGGKTINSFCASCFCVGGKDNGPLEIHGADKHGVNASTIDPKIYPRNTETIQK